MPDPTCPATTGDHASTYSAGHWRCMRCGYHGCHEGDCEPGVPFAPSWWPLGDGNVHA
jgi:hypothetical protein